MLLTQGEARETCETLRSTGTNKLEALGEKPSSLRKPHSREFVLTTRGEMNARTCGAVGCLLGRVKPPSAYLLSANLHARPRGKREIGQAGATDRSGMEQETWNKKQGSAEEERRSANEAAGQAEGRRHASRQKQRRNRQDPNPAALPPAVLAQGC